MFETALLLLFPAGMAFAGAMDLLTMTIPNRISIALVAGFLVIGPLLGLGPQDMLMHMAAGAIVLSAGFVLFALGGLGGGDAKLLAAAAVWIGMDQLVVFLAYVTIFGGMLAIAIMLYRRVPVLGPFAPDWAIDLHRPGTGIPYGIAIAASALMIFPKTPLVLGALL